MDNNNLLQNTNTDLLVAPIENISITPTLTSGTKIADYTIDDTSGSLYAPKQYERITYSGLIALIEHTLTSAEISNGGITEILNVNKYDNWLSTGLVTSVPLITMKVLTLQGLGAGTEFVYSMNKHTTGGYSSSFIGVEALTRTGFTVIRSWYDTPDPTLIDYYVQLEEYNAGAWSNVFSEGDKIYIDVRINAVKLV